MPQEEISSQKNDQMGGKYRLKQIIPKHQGDQ
jgi:hypothetical protein